MQSTYGAASITTPAAPAPAAPEHAVLLRGLDEHLSTDQSFTSALARTVGAIASTDGALTLAQFAAVTDLAGDGRASAVFTALMLNAIECGVTVDWALHALARSSHTVGEPARHSAFNLMKPLLALQGTASRPLAQNVAKALHIKLAPEQLFGLPPEAERRLLSNLGNQARKLVKGRGLADAVADFGRSMGHAELLNHARAYNGGLMSQDELHDAVERAVTAICSGIESYREHEHSMLACEAGAASLLATAQQLHHQVQQRLALVDARIAYERSVLTQDIEDAVHDAGNAIELALIAHPEVNEHASGTHFGKEMESRLDRVVRRKEEVLDLLQHDLSLFQSDIRLTQSTVFERQHHATLARLMPRMRVGTRVAQTVDTAANITLMGSAVAAAGTGTAAYLFGVAVVLPVVAPAAPFVGGAVLLAGAFKWFADAGRRKRSEIQDRRCAFEDELRKRLQEVQAAFGRQLDRVASSFHESATQLLTPLMLEAEAAGRVQAVRKRIADKVIAQAQHAIAQLRAAMTAHA
ncbi:hypothetical protein [Pseudoduganella violaceinigra]|uniref:hypothetical protein n=1 Tax=Pseudoduganella violaceinigra TaxID=246602 RepID=UPI001E4548A7|nr:hypothetical protein [Pseudoduganella violaceinigra]